MAPQKSADSPRFGEVLRELRVAQGLSQEELAERAAMSVNGISALERGANQSPQRKTLELIVHALGLHAEQQEALEAAATRRSRPRAIEPAQTSVDGLPRASTPVFGRDEDVDAIIQLIERDPLVTLTGAGGIGKTRLALCIAEKLANRFGDAVEFIDLASLRDDESVSCAIESHTESGRARTALLIIDNCEHVVSAAATAIASILQRSPRLRVLVTSRQSLNVPGEQVYRVKPLSLPAAVDLFAERAKRATGAFSVTPDNRSAIARICSRLDGLALAIELAAARTKLLTLDELEARLCERFHLLSGGSELMLPRHHTMRATIDWSYRLLSACEQQTLIALAVFPGSFSLDAVLTICDDAPDDGEWPILDALQSLVDKSLLNSDANGGVTRYRMLETTRAYVEECIAESPDRCTIRTRHLHYYANLAAEAESSLASTTSTSGWAHALEADFENFLAALEWAFDGGKDPVTGSELLCSLQEFWIVQGFAAEAARRAKDALDFESLPSTLRGRLWLTLARMRQELFVHPEQALEAAKCAEQLLSKSDERDSVALALRQQAAAHMKLGAYQEAHDEFERSLGIYRELGDQRMIGRGLGYIASLYLIEDAFARARATLLDVLDLARAVGDDRMIPTVMMNLAEAEFGLGDASGAAERAQQNLSTEVLRKSCDMAATQEANLAVYLLALGRTEEAQAMALASIDDAPGSFPAVPIQHFAATIVESQPRIAARLLGYVETVFSANAFTRQYTERYSYDRLMAVLHRTLGDDAVARYEREGSMMTSTQVLQLARSSALAKAMPG